MRPLWRVGSLCAVLLLAADAGTARAAWHNVFQVCCLGCRQPTTSAYAAPAPACNACPQQVCTTRYVQRSFYQPVTVYQSRSYYEPVTTYRTSYFWEPVQSCSYSCYYDPCSCSYQQVAKPVTSYRLRSQCCPVQSWVQRCSSVPVTSYRIASYWEPVTTCCQAPPACPTCPTAMAVPVAPAPCNVPSAPPQQLVPTPAPPSAPGVMEQRVPNVPGVQENPRGNGTGSPLYDRTFQNNGSSYRVPTLRTVPPSNPPAIRFDRVVSLPQSQLRGQVVSDDQRPQPGARIVFVSMTAQKLEQQVTADSAGQFQVTLASGGWMVFVRGADNRAIAQGKIQLAEREARQIVLKR